MIDLIAQTTLPTTQPAPDIISSISELLKAIATIVGLIAGIWAVLKGKTLSTNLSILGTSVEANRKAIDHSDFTPNVPASVGVSTRAIIDNPTVVAPKPVTTEPIANVIMSPKPEDRVL